MKEFNAKLSDFGLAKDGPMGDQTHVSTRVMGTYGYAAPEYIMTGEIFWIYFYFLTVPFSFLFTFYFITSSVLRKYPLIDCVNASISG